MDREKFRKLLLYHHANRGPVIVRHSGRYHMIPYNHYEVIDDPLCPHIEVCVEEEGNYKIPYFRHNLNTCLWLVDSEESKRLKTLAKEENTMEKTNVILGVAVIQKPAAKITKIVVNKVDRCTVVFFDDGKSENVKCSPEDEFDPYVGVAIAKARHEYGSTGAFHRAVDAVSLIVEPKVKKVKMGPIAPGQQPVKKPAIKKPTKKSPAKKK